MQQNFLKAGREWVWFNVTPDT